MNDEAAFYATIEAHPEDHLARLVFADWLQEQGDRRAEGYRALGVNQLRPRFYQNRFKWYDAKNQHGAVDVPSDLPSDWFHATRKDKTQLASGKDSAEFETRRQAEDAAAIAFSRLPTERRAELLTGTADTRK